MTETKEKQQCEEVSIADLNLQIFGQEELARMTKNRHRRDFKSYLYLLLRFKFRSLYNFYYTKNYVPTGEGFFKGKDGEKTKLKSKVPIPNYVELEPTTSCNKKCYICEVVYWPKKEQVRRHLKFDEFKYIMDQFPNKIRWMNITGEGSSFLNRDYPNMLKYMYDKYRTSLWFVDFLGDMDTDKLENDILPYVHGIYVSMDGATKETYEKVKVGCSFEKAVENLKKIIEYKRKYKTPFPHISFRYVILKDNIHELPQFVDLINSIAGPDEWGGSSSIIEFTGLLYYDEVKQYYVETIPKEVIDELLKRKNDGIEFIFSHAEEDKNPQIDTCTAWLEPYIMLPGYVMPCCSVMMSNRRPYLRKYSFGNVFKDDFKDIWNNDYYSKFKDIINDPDAPVPSICVGCRAYRTQERVARNGIWDVYEDDSCKHEEFNELNLSYDKGSSDCNEC